jgi:hypothetical protein
MRLEELKIRNDIGKVLKAMDLDGFGVEVGVEYGINAELILETSDLRRLYLIDAWGYVPGHDPRGFGVGYSDWQTVLNQCQQRMQRFSDRAVLMRTTSIQIVTSFADGSLDFVYIDANHMSPWIDEDLTNWFKKVRVGGIIGGHDYLNRNEPTFQCDVKRVVDDFFTEPQEIVHVTEDAVPSWYVIKGA